MLDMLSGHVGRTYYSGSRKKVAHQKLEADTLDTIYVQCTIRALSPGVWITATQANAALYAGCIGGIYARVEITQGSTIDSLPHSLLHRLLSMESTHFSRPRRHSGAYAHLWDTVAEAGHDESVLSGFDIPRPKSAPPVENHWLSLPASEDYASDDTQSDLAPSDSSSDESSPPSTRPSS